ncbi:intraflagellar transport protein 20 homolog [Lepeophtheirus salmonis]|uniref:intraflagellar transport protein 20 homolog n=1 Tax=Lepeophtheirus salmonis TaxID=72036 RepID=UPI001AE6B955|nr:intraflagellar transport protein 20 homolog [Lepeophtheirus salmonis]
MNNKIHLEPHGVHFDDLNRIRVLDEASDTQAKDLQDSSYEFLNIMGDFQKKADGFIKTFDLVSKEVEQEKMCTLGLRNLLQSYKKKREKEIQQLSALMKEKQNQYERLKIEYEALKKVEESQQEFMEQFILQK